MNVTHFSKIAGLLFWAALATGLPTDSKAETIEQYAQQCDAAIGATVPDYHCDAGTDVPIADFVNGNDPNQIYPNGYCDEPNRLNQACDPGSKFQVLTNNSTAYVVAHCRKHGAGATFYKDIAVIQHNKTNGATCFYQALGNALPEFVRAPSAPNGWPWLSPAGTAGIQCVRCHDNGAIIRSPYLAQLSTGPNALPGATDFSFNSTQAYAFVGSEFKNWRVFKVEINNNACIVCHRLGVSNLASGVSGTAIDFGIRASSMSEIHKNAYSNASHIWMPPNHVLFDQTYADAAKQIHDCALRVTENPLPNDLVTCSISEYTGTPFDNGDPHITTVNGVHYDFQGAGEFVALRGFNGLEIQTRQSPVSTSSVPGPDAYSGLATCVSLNTAVAARVGAHRVTYEPNLSGVPDPSGLQLRVDGNLIRLSNDGMDLGEGGRVARAPLGQGIEVTFPDGTLLVVTPGWWESQGKWYLDVSANHTLATAGVMGHITQEGWLPALANGVSVGSAPSALHDRYVTLYGTFANAWRVTGATSLFDYAPGTSAATFALPAWPKENPSSCVIPTAPLAQSVDARTAERACSVVVDTVANRDCRFDVAVTGEVGFAQTYLITQKLQPGATETRVASNPNPTHFGDVATFTATVVATRKVGAAPAGRVQFMVDGVNRGEPVTLDAHGAAMRMISNLSVGSHVIAADFVSTRSTILGSRSAAVTHTVLQGRHWSLWWVLAVLVLILVLWVLLKIP